MGHLAVVVTLIGAIALILRECGVFERIRQYNLNKPVKKEKREPEKVYDHQWDDDDSDRTT